MVSGWDILLVTMLGFSEAPPLLPPWSGTCMLASLSIFEHMGFLLRTLFIILRSDLSLCAMVKPWIMSVLFYMAPPFSSLAHGHELDTLLLGHFTWRQVVGTCCSRICRLVWTAKLASLQTPTTREIVANVTTPQSLASLGLLVLMNRLAKGSNPTLRFQDQGKYS